MALPVMSRYGRLPAHGRPACDRASSRMAGNSSPDLGFHHRASPGSAVVTLSPGRPGSRMVQRSSYRQPTDITGRFIGRRDQPVRRVLQLGRQDDLGVAPRHPQASLPDLVMAPQQLMAHGITVKAQATVKIGYPYRDGVHLLQQRSICTASPRTRWHAALRRRSRSRPRSPCA